MNTPANTRWLVSPSEFVRGHKDYAFPRADSANIKAELREWDFGTYDLLPWTAFGFVCASDSTPCYKSATEGALVYADVTGTAKHKQLVERLQATNVLDAHQEAVVEWKQREIRDKLVAMYKQERILSGATLGHEREVWGAEGEDRKMKRILKVEGAFIEPQIVKLILGCPDRAEKAAILNLYSGEDSVKLPRPTLMLISMFDEAKSTRYAESSGYLVAYDFLSNRVIIKHWTSSLDHHPLQDAWFKAPANDGVSYLGSPNDFVQRIIDRDGLVQDSPNYCFGLVTRFLAGRWLLKYFSLPGLAIAKASETSNSVKVSSTSVPTPDCYEALRAAITSYAAELETIDVPGVNTDPVGTKLDTPYKQVRSDVQSVYGGALDFFEKWELDLQEIAVGEREEGNEKIAEYLAKFYDGVTRAARTLFLEPEANFTFE